MLQHIYGTEKKNVSSTSILWSSLSCRELNTGPGPLHGDKNAGCISTPNPPPLWPGEFRKGKTTIAITTTNVQQHLRMRHTLFSLKYLIWHGLIGSCGVCHPKPSVSSFFSSHSAVILHTLSNRETAL